MGPTGAGKTTLVNELSGANFKVGHGLESETQQIQTATCSINGQQVHLIDTPGFDDTYKTDADILNLIATHLADTYRSGCQLAGILYLHRITDNRVGGVSYKNMKVFETLCGEGAMASVILCTTMWSQVPEHVGATREEELVAEFWRNMIRKGAAMRRMLDSQDSATQIISSLIELRRPVTLDIQREIVDQGKPISETTAARDLEREKEELLRQLEAELTRPRPDPTPPIKEQQTRLLDHLERQHREYETRLSQEAEQWWIDEGNRQAEIARLQQQLAAAQV